MELAEQDEMDLVRFFRTGMSFSICRNAHRWPPLATLNSFLQCGYDDIADGRLLRWAPFEVTDAEYLAAVGEVDPQFTIDALGTNDGDWQRWFSLAVA